MPPAPRADQVDEDEEPFADEDESILRLRGEYPDAVRAVRSVLASEPSTSDAEGVFAFNQLYAKALIDRLANVLEEIAQLQRALVRALSVADSPHASDDEWRRLEREDPLMKRAPVSAIRRDERAAQLQSELDRHGRIAERILRAAEHRDSHEERLEVLAAYARAGQRRALRRAVRALARDKTGAPLDDDDKRILNSEFSQVGNAILRRLMQREAPEVIAAKPDLPWEWSYQHAYEELSAAPCLRRIGLLDHAEMRAAIDAHDFPSAQLWKTSRFARSLKSADGDPKKADDPRWAYFAALLDHIVGPVRTGAKTQLPGNSLRVTWSNWNFRKWSERRRRTARSTRGPTDT